MYDFSNFSRPAATILHDFYKNCVKSAQMNNSIINIADTKLRSKK